MIIHDTEDLGGLFLCSLTFTVDVVSGWSVKQGGQLSSVVFLMCRDTQKGWFFLDSGTDYCLENSSYLFMQLGGLLMSLK